MDAITQEESTEVRDVLSRFYGPVARTWAITPNTYDVLGRMITASEACTRAMHLVPRPWDVSSPVKWAKRQVRQAIVRYLKTPEGQHYLTCMKVAANNFRMDFEMASHGL
ncbi:MAG: hypothetical protein DWQ11_13415 [Proteobacteria bacterium]|nr:MAG: hypothetical protein DWQ11_13415 [Pseudomonadota bacterium]